MVILFVITDINISIVSAGNNMKKQDLIELLSQLPDDIEVLIMSSDHLRKELFRYHPVRGCDKSEVALDYSAGFGIYKHLHNNEQSNELTKVAILY